uniref:Uncharacterized protein n=1 Tax=Zea mays TaxID=4577 RepID=C4J7A7_MAIZE|nr:unknown [Zea mays]
MHRKGIKLHHPLFAICYNGSEYCVSIDNLCCCNKKVVAHSFLCTKEAKGSNLSKCDTTNEYNQNQRAMTNPVNTLLSP